MKKVDLVEAIRFVTEYGKPDMVVEGVDGEKITVDINHHIQLSGNVSPTSIFTVTEMLNFDTKIASGVCLASTLNGPAKVTFENQSLNEFIDGNESNGFIVKTIYAVSKSGYELIEVFNDEKGPLLIDVDTLSSRHVVVNENE